MTHVRHVLLLWLSGCTAQTHATAPAPESTPARAPAPSAAERAAAERVQKYGLDLPRATNTSDWPDFSVPHVVIRGVEVFLDDAPVDDVGQIVAGGRLERLDGLFRALKGRRDEPSQGVVVLWFGAATPALVVKSVFQTAAFAGFPKGSFAVRSMRTGQLARIDADARVPGPPTLERPITNGDPFALHVECRAGKTQLVWKNGSQVVQVLDVGDGALRTMIAEQWQRHGGHREASDQTFDQAILHVDNQTRFDAIVDLIDSMYGPQRDFADGESSVRAPAFNVTFAVN